MPTDRETEAGRIAWLDVLKGLAILWIVWNHLAERSWGGPLFANPFAGWPPLAERIAQVNPVLGSPLADAARWLGWLGDQGVQLFLIVSGFGLTWSLLARPRATSDGFLGWFYRRRLWRLYPTWWAAHVLVLLPAFLLGWGIFSLDSRLLLSLLGLRVTPAAFYYLFPAWWFIGLVLQLYAVFPLLWSGLRRWGPSRFFWFAATGGILARVAGLLFLDNGLDPWLRGIVFVTRLPEFALGMALAVWWHGRREDVATAWLRPAALPAAVVLYAAGNVLSFLWLGNAVSSLLTGAGFLWLFLILAPSRRRGRVTRCERPLAWAGRHSYAVFLVHHPLIVLLMPRKQLPWLPLVVTLLLIVPAALLIEQVASRGERLARRWFERGGWPRLLRGAALCGAGALAVCVGLEGAVRRFDPQEVLGWGERVSLQPDPDLGYRMVPNGDFRLRWEGYDYRVRTSALGFPAPAYPEAKPSGTYRILTLGDAFTSAEGVDTEQAWPRLLETNLRAAAPSRSIEVLNFGVTAYGPQQYARLAADCVPRFRPDLVIIGFFVNEYNDVTRGPDELRASIGFASPSQSGWRSFLRPHHLRSWFAGGVLQPARRFLYGERSGPGSAWGQFRQFEVDNLIPGDARIATVREKLAAIRDTARADGAEVLLLLIPASIQVMAREDLPYFPSGIDLADTTRFDLDRPQRITIGLARELGLEWLDLRPVLSARAGERYYPRRNMHWTPAGHRAVAAAVAREIRGRLPAS